MLVERARSLRRNPTDAERRMWSLLRRRQIDGHRFRRQRPMGRYIVDFVCLKQSLIIEVDGGQHAENKADDVRTTWLESRGFRVVRFWNNDVLTNPEGVIEVIRMALRDPPP